MDKISFFTPISAKDISKPARLFLLEKVDSYFYLGGKKAKILSISNDFLEYDLVDGKVSIITVALKINYSSTKNRLLLYHPYTCYHARFQGITTSSL